MSDKKYEIDMNLMGERIRLLREELGFSRDDLAKILGITSRHLAGIETGNKGLSLEVFYNLKNELNSSADYILDGKGKEEDADARRVWLEENILGHLSACNIKQLECLEAIVRSYVRSHVDKEEE